MALQDKYINPFTDYGFKKLFEAAEIARFDPEEKARYEESLKYYRDLKNVVDTSFEEGREEGKIEVILKSHAAGLGVETIAKITGKSIEEVKKAIDEAVLFPILATK